MPNLPIVAIVGRPNVGKSSLFNRLMQNKQAIVADEAGTTRDVVKNIAQWNGSYFWLVDTAGVKTKFSDELEISIQEQVSDAMTSADAILLVLEAGVGTTDVERNILRDIQKSSKPCFVVLNKIDTTLNTVPSESYKLGIDKFYPISSIHGTGSGDLLDAITATVRIASKNVFDDKITTIGLVGRPNVGKSSIFNKLLARHAAVVSDIPGTTRDVNIQHLTYEKNVVRLLDTAGIRRNGKQKGIEKFSVIRTIKAINELDIAILVLDATEPAVSLDQKLASLVAEAGKGLIIAVNKWDLIENPTEIHLRIEKLLRNQFRFVAWAPYVLASAQNGRNVVKILELCLQIKHNRAIKLKTSELNNTFQSALRKHPPSGMKNLHPKLNYITQTNISPPEFAIFGTHVDYIHPTYKRYLDTKLREEFGLFGTPIRLMFKSKHKNTVFGTSQTKKNLGRIKRGHG